MERAREAPGKVHGLLLMSRRRQSQSHFLPVLLQPLSTRRAGLQGDNGWETPGHELRQETGTACQDQSHVSASCPAVQPLRFISRGPTTVMVMVCSVTQWVQGRVPLCSGAITLHSVPSFCARSLRPSLHVALGRFRLGVNDLCQRNQVGRWEWEWLERGGWGAGRLPDGCTPGGWGSRD